MVPVAVQAVALLSLFTAVEFICIQKYPVVALSVSDENNLLLSGDSSGEIRLWELSLGECLQVWQAHDSKITDLAILSQSRQVISVSQEPLIRTWDLDTGQFPAFYIYLYEQGGAYPTDSWIDVSAQPQGETMAYINPGAYYLDFDVINCDYTVTVEVYVPP